MNKGITADLKSFDKLDRYGFGMVTVESSLYIFGGVKQRDIDIDMTSNVRTANLKSGNAKIVFDTITTFKHLNNSMIAFTVRDV